MKRIEITIEGTAPLMMNRFTDEAQMSATSGNRASTVGERLTPEDDAKSRLYHDIDGDICIPTPNLLRCLMEGGKFEKVGKSKVTTMRSSLVPACVSIDGVAVKLQHKQQWRVDARPIRNPATGGRIIRYRPIFEDWKVQFSVSLDTDIMSEGMLRRIVDNAGKRIGLGDFRPDCKGPFGKFVVTRWETEEIEAAVAA